MSLFYDKRDLTLLSFIFLFYNKPLLPACGVYMYISKIIRYSKVFLRVRTFQIEVNYKQKMMLKGYNESHLKSSYRRFYCCL
jgi:hypothetical protein